MIEVWLPIQGYESLYEISNLGRIKSCEKTRGTGYKCRISEKIMSPSDNGNGYLTVGLNANRKKRGAYLHRLVAQMFIPNPENKPEVNHIDGDKSNCAATNLEWSTRKENEEHAYKTGLKLVGKGRFNSKPIRQLTLTGELIRDFDNSKCMEREIGLNASVVRRAVTGKISTAYGFKWIAL